MLILYQHHESSKYMFQDFRYSDTAHLSRSVKVLKLKNFKKDATLKLFKNGMSMSVQKSQVHKLAKLQDGIEIAQKEKKEWEVKFEATLARFEKWKESSKNLKNLIDSSMSTRTKVVRISKSTFGAGEMHAVPPPITGTYMPSPYQSDIEETQVSYGSKSDNNISDTISESNDFVSCDNSDKSSDSETHASCVIPSSRPRPKDIPPLFRDIQTLPESDVEDPNSTTGSPSFSCSENVKSPRIICNKSGVNNRKISPFVKSKAAYVPAAVNPADRPHPAGWSKRPATVSAGRPVSAGWLNPAARPFFRPSSVYNTNWPNIYDPMIKGRGNGALRPQQVTLGGIKDHNFGGPRVMVDLVNPHGFTLNDPQGRLKKQGKNDDFVQKSREAIVKFWSTFKLFFVSQICDKKNKVLFTDTDCLVLSEEFQLPDASQVVLRIPRKHDLYTFHISDLQPEQKVTCLVAKASLDESTRWHRRMAHVNFKNTQPVRLKETLQLLHMDLFGPTNIRSIDQKMHGRRCISSFVMTLSMGIKRDYSNPRTPQQNGVAERKNRTLIEAARTMLADSKLPTMFWTEAVSTACYVLNRVSITNPHNKTPYELISGKVPQISHLKPFGCQVTILNTSDNLGKFEGKADDGYLVGYSFKIARPIGFKSTKHEGRRNPESEILRRINLMYRELKRLAKHQDRQEYEAKATAEILCQAEAEIQNQGVSAVKDPAGVDSAVREPVGIVSADGVSTGSPSADSDPAGGNPADSFPPAAGVKSAFSIEKLKKKCMFHSSLKALEDPYFPKHLESYSDMIMLGLMVYEIHYRLDVPLSGQKLASSGSGSLDSEPVAGIMNANEKNLIQVLKIHTDDNVADLLTKAFDGPRFAYLVRSIMGCESLIGMRGGGYGVLLVSADRTMVLLVVILPAGRMVSAGCTNSSAGSYLSCWTIGFCWLYYGSAGSYLSCSDDWFSAGCTMVAMDYAAGSVYMLVRILLLVDSFLLIGCLFLLSTWFLLLDDSFCCHYNTNGGTQYKDDHLPTESLIKLGEGKRFRGFSEYPQLLGPLSIKEKPLTPTHACHIAAAGDAADETENAACQIRSSGRAPETEGIPNPVSPVTDWRPWPSVSPT
ncbi:putative ribonuclease H-like domain-containing protein [Tanacetum coccineum]